jgi:hypothetical protein
MMAYGLRCMRHRTSISWAVHCRLQLLHRMRHRMRHRIRCLDCFAVGSVLLHFAFAFRQVFAWQCFNAVHSTQIKPGPLRPQPPPLHLERRNQQPLPRRRRRVVDPGAPRRPLRPLPTSPGPARPPRRTGRGGRWGSSGRRRRSRGGSRRRNRLPTAGEPNAARRGAAPAPAAIRVITGWGWMRAPWQAGAPVRDRVAALLAALDAPLLLAGGNRGLLELDPAAPAAGRPTRWPAPAPARGACAPSAAAASAPGQSPGPRAAGTPAGQECG